MIETLKLCRDRKMLLLIPVILYNGACQSRRREPLAYTSRLAYPVRLAYVLTARLAYVRTARGRRMMLLLIHVMPTQRSGLTSSTRAVSSGVQLLRSGTIQQPHPAVCDYKPTSARLIFAVASACPPRFRHEPWLHLLDVYDVRLASGGRHVVLARARCHPPLSLCRVGPTRFGRSRLYLQIHANRKYF